MPVDRSKILCCLFCFTLFALSGCDDFTFIGLLDETSAGGSTEEVLEISPISVTIQVNSQTPFSASGGTPPYTFSVISGTGEINDSNGVYTAPAQPGTDIIQVMDSTGATSKAQVIYFE